MVSRDDPGSLHKEYLIFLDIERELLADTFTMFDLVYSRNIPVFGKMFVDTKLPWLFSADAKAQEADKKKSTVERLVELYKEFERNKNKQKE